MQCLCGRVHSQANKAQLRSISNRTTEHHCPIVPLPPACYSPVLASKHSPSSNIRLGCPCFVLQRTKHLWNTTAAKNTMLHCLDRKNKTHSYKYIPYIKSAYVEKFSKMYIKTALVVFWRLTLCNFIRRCKALFDVSKETASACKQKRKPSICVTSRLRHGAHEIFALLGC